MRTFLITILAIWTCNCYAQTRKVKHFKMTVYSYIYDELYEQKTDTIAIGNKSIDIYSFKSYLNLPYGLPEKLTDEQHAGQTIAENNPSAGSNYQSNWVNRYSYDSAGRLINFSYSSCIACSSLPYNYAITYNSKGQVATIISHPDSRNRFECYYSTKGEIIKLAKYSSKLLETEITFIR